MASWAPPLRTTPRRPRREQSQRRDRDLGVLRLGHHVVSDRDARLLAQRLDELKEHLAESDEGGQLCEAARARVADDLELVTAALERSARIGLRPL